MLRFLLCLLLFFAVYFVGSFWAILVPQGSAQLIAWAIAGGLSFILLLIVFGIIYWLSDEVFILYSKWWYWGPSIMLALVTGLIITPRLMYPAIAGYMGHPSGVSTNNLWSDIGWVLSGIWHGIVWVSVPLWSGTVWTAVGIWHGIVWAAVGIWSGLVWLFGWVIALIATIMTLIIIPIIVTLIANDAVGNQRIRPLSGVYYFLQNVGFLTVSEENKQPTTPLKWSAPSLSRRGKKETSELK